MRWFTTKYKTEINDYIERQSRRMYELESEMYKLRKLDIEFDCLRYGLNPLESRLIYTTSYDDLDRKKAKEDGFVLKGITKCKTYEIWIKEPAKD